jgi:hypothetical protein
MPSDEGTLQQLFAGLMKIFAPFRQAITDGEVLLLLAELGIEFPDELADDANFAGAVDNLGALFVELPGMLERLSNAIDTDDTAAIVSVTVELIDAIRRAVNYFNDLASAIEARKNSLPGLTPQDVEDFVAGLWKRIIDYLIVVQAETGVPSIAVVLDLIGVFDRVEKNIGSANPLKPPYVERSINSRRALDFLQSPSDVIRDRYDWGAGGFDGSVLFAKLEKLGHELGLPAIYTPAPVPTLDFMFVAARPRTDLSPPGLQIDIAEPIKAGSELTLPGEGWELVFGADISIEVGSSLVLTPDGELTITPPAGDMSGSGSVLFRTVTDSADSPFILIGEAEASRVEFKEFSTEAKARIVWIPSDGEARTEIETIASIKEGQIVIDLSGADSFIGEIASAARISAPFDISAGYSTEDGFHFHGSAALEIQLPVHVDLGLIEFQGLTISVGFDDGKIPIGIGADIKANLGVLQAVVEDMGIRIDFSFPDDGGGNLGPMDIGIGFKPPNGVGLSIDAGIVKGGGYLYFDFDNEEYAGALELEISGIVTVKAIGLITTRLPDGSDGFSLLVIISAEFGTPFQLGFGFTLNAVGGLLGLNRTMELERIAQGIRTGAIDSVMFPDDVVANAPRIISDLREFFPPAADRFLVGPMAMIGWGTPTLVSLSLGIVVEIPPGNIAILGVLKVALPDETVPLILIQVNFIGALEVDKERLWFFAGLFESRVIFTTLEGEMGLLMAWGHDANFVLSVGGFHPSYSPPPMPFPEPRRISVSILNEPLASVRVEGYFAVTSNTVQFGARAEVFFGLSEFGISGHVGFDALFQFSPFYFIITISASLDVKVFGIGLFSVRMRGELEGTSPWHIEGEGSISLLFWDIDVPFSHTWGENENTTLPPIEIMPLIEEEFNKLENWTAELPPANSILVSLNQIESTDDLILHPVGVLKVSQRALPLDLDLDKVGNQTPSDAKRITVEILDADLDKTADTTEQFATAQYKALSDSAKLSSPAYEKQHSGVELSVSGNQLKSHSAIKRVVRYEEIIIDNNFLRRLRRFVGFPIRLFAHFLSGNAVSKSRLSASYTAKKTPIDLSVAVLDAQYVVASTMDNSPLNASAQFASHAQAQDYMRDVAAQSPELADSLHVIPATEMKEAA